MPPYKSWFEGLGLHHAGITAGLIAVCHYIGIGPVGAAFALGWYGQREWGLQLGFPKTFDIMDFASPAIVSILYLIFAVQVNG